MRYKYEISPKAARKIWSFYRNVAKKYRHTFVEEDISRNVSKTVRAIFGIENGLSRRKPIIIRWQDYHMAHAAHWYYAYTIEPDGTIIIHDACHELNMHE